MTTDTEDKDAVMRRIQKLLAIAQDGRGDPNEAAAAAGMAERLMRKFQLAHIDVVMAQMKRDDAFDTADVIVTAKTNGTAVRDVPLWGQWLASALKELHDVRAVVTMGKDGNVCVRFMGFRSDVEVAAWTLRYLADTVNRLCLKYRDSNLYRAYGRKEMNAYRLGVVVGIRQNVEALVEEKRWAMQTNDGRALVVAKKQAVAERFGEGRSRAVKTTVAGYSYARGRDDGKAVDVGRRAVGNESQDTTLRLK